MIGAQVLQWTDRVLEQGKLGMLCEESWKLEAYREYRDKLLTADYPCFFGQTGELREEMMYTFAGMNALEDAATNMREFVRLHAEREYERTSLVLFMKPDADVIDHPAFVHRFWSILQFLHDRDGNPATARTPEHPLWEFSFGGCEMFVVGASPTYRQRRSRNLGAGVVLIFQPRNLFIDPATSQPIAPEVRHRIHKRMLAYDGMAVHPDIGFYGKDENREWKQYVLPDDNAPVSGGCPFHRRSR